MFQELDPNAPLVRPQPTKLLSASTSRPLSSPGSRTSGRKRPSAAVFSVSSWAFRLASRLNGITLRLDRVCLGDLRGHAGLVGEVGEAGDGEQCGGQTSDRNLRPHPLATLLGIDRPAARHGQGLHVGVDAEFGRVRAGEPGVGLDELRRVEQAALAPAEPDPFLGLGDEAAAGLLGVAAGLDPLAEAGQPTISISCAMSTRRPRGSSGWGSRGGCRSGARACRRRPGIVGLGAEVVHAELAAGVGPALAELDQAEEDPPGHPLLVGGRSARVASAFVAIATARPLRPSRPRVVVRGAGQQPARHRAPEQHQGLLEHRQRAGLVGRVGEQPLDQPLFEVDAHRFGRLDDRLPQRFTTQRPTSMIWLRSTGQNGLFMRSP